MAGGVGVRDLPDLQIKWEWVSAPTIKAPELCATWAHLEIRAGAEYVTLVEEAESGSSRRSIFVPLYPLAEWIAFNWWFLQAHTRPATALSRLPKAVSSLWTTYGVQYRQRHSLRGVGDGFLWPNAFLLPEGETTRVIWTADQLPPSQERTIRFLTSGSLSVDTTPLMHRLGGVVESVLQRLVEQGVGETPLSNEWATIQDTDDEEADFCLAAARLGLDPYSEAAKYEQDILKTAHELEDRDLLRDFLDVVDPDKIAPNLAWVSVAMSEINKLPSRPGRDVAELRAVARSSTVDDYRQPWEVGWEQARRIRQAAGLRPDQTFEIERLITNIIRPTSSPGLQALGGVRGGASPLIALSHRPSEQSKRFTLARAMWHVLWEEPTTFLITSAHTDRQKVERAFAAELLAPAEGIWARLVDDSVHSGLEEPSLEELANYFRVSTALVQHQIENQVLLR
jgi:hypothetical protein